MQTTTPHLIDVEVLAALLGLVRAGRISADRAADAQTDFSALLITRHPFEAMADRAWALRENVTPYDAALLILAELADRPLVTCDGRLARVPGTSAVVELFGVAER